MTLRNFHSQTFEEQRPEIPPVFASLEEAHESYQYHVNRYALLGYEIRQRPIPLAPERVSEPRKYLEIFRQWHHGVQAFLQRSGYSLSLTAQQAVRILQLNLHMMALNIDVTTNDQLHLQVWDNSIPQIQQLNPLAWDNYTSRFQQITALARKIIEHSIALDAPQRLRNFALDTNIVATLYFVVSLCRDPLVRREAVSLLYELPLQEGLWDSAATARICEKLVNIEEEGLGEVTCCEDVPEWARVRSVQMGFDMEGRAGKISYRRHNGVLGLDEADYEELLEWK